MIFFADSVLKHIRKQVERHLLQGGVNNKLLIMMPSIPASAACTIGKQLEGYCTGQEELTLPIIKISKDLYFDWENSNDPDIHHCSEEIAKKGWNDEQGNLTSYRNLSNKKDGLLIVLLIGVDRVTDASSLLDFHHCDFNTIWEDLDKNFSPWIKQLFDKSFIGFEEETVKHFNYILISLINKGLSDILQISTLLEELNLSTAQDGRDAEQILLQSLSRFGLPLFIGYKFTSQKSFGPYIDGAIDFFTYNAFLEERSRNKALKSIDDFIENNSLGDLFPQSDREPFKSDEDFINGIKDYIESGDENLGEKLKKCDFVTIRDRILNYKSPKKNGVIGKQHIKKLSGSPVEVILTALWNTFAEFKKITPEYGNYEREILKEINIESTLFKHDCSGDTPDERKESALAYLSRLLGGLDLLVEEHIDLEKIYTNGNRIEIHSTLYRDDLDCQFARTSEPCLQFSVTLIGEDLEKPVQKMFAWRLPEIEPYRIADEIFQRIAQEMKNIEGYCLPVFNIPYFEELMLAKDDEETCRVLLQCIDNEGNCIFNLLDVSGINKKDPLLKYINKLAIQYDVFIQKAAKDGLHSVFDDTWDKLRQAYEQAFDAYLTKPECSKSPLATLLFRSFLIIQQRKDISNQIWPWEPYEKAGIITVVHPALLEMLQSQAIYLFTCFNTLVVRELKALGSKKFQDSLWQNYVDLAKIQMPLCGLIKSENRILDTDIRGGNLIYRIGNIENSEASLTTRLLLRYDEFNEVDISDAEIFRQTRESKVYYNILRDYRKLHPHANDGLSLAIYQNKDIQPIIAAVDQYLKDICNEEDNSSRKYFMSISVFTESADDSSVSRWINQWKERWETSEVQESLSHYQKTTMSIAHRIVSSKNNYVQFKQIVKQGLEVDIVFLSNFIGAGMRGNEFEEVEPYDVTTRTLKFPILEKSFCAIGDPGKNLQRARILSNRQFSLTTRYSELLARLKNRETPQNTHHVVLGFGDYYPWQGVIDELHNHAEWVICIDPNIDEKLIAQKSNVSSEAEMREIIGFGSGVGSHGEDNYTISTEQFHLSDVLHSLTASIGELYTGWANSYKEVAQSILRESRQLSGLSLVRATGLGEYIRDFMAYALTRKLISADENVICDQLVSLDAYQHWFDSAESKTRPDLLWVVARVGSDQRIHLDLKLIECKLAKMSDVHLDKAQLQLKNGLQHLIEVFMPRRDDNSIEDDRPDQRYWWLQLHRLIASKAKITGYDQSRVLTALERMAEGDYSIKWGASAITYWTDQKKISLSLNAIWPFSFEGQELDIGVVYAGSDFVRDLCTSRISETLPWGERMVRFDSVIQKIRLEEDKESGESEIKEKDESGKIDISRFPEPSKTVVSTKSETAPKKQEDKIDIGLSVPQRILLGKTINGNRDVYWEFGHDELNNRHMLIFGASGMGKTYAVQCLLWELGRAGENSLIVDYTNGFFDNQLESEIKILLRPVQHIIQKEPLAINPFRQQMVNIAGEFTPEGFVSTAQRVSGVFSEVYNFGDQQKSALYQAIKSWLELNTGKCMGLYNLIPRLKEIQEQKGVTGTSAGSVISKIQPFVDQNPFGTEDQESWNKIFNDFEHHCHIIQLAGFAKDAARLITEFLLIDLYWYYRGKGSKDNPHVLVLDEVQNLDHREESPLAQLLREGRKFGFSLILATQIMSNLEKDERDRLFNAAHKLFFRPADTEIKKYAEIAAIFTDEKVDAWIKKLAALKKGECYSLGPSLNESTGSLEFKAFHIVITSLKDRSNLEKK